MPMHTNNPFKYRQYFITPMVDASALHSKAQSYTTGEDAEEKVIVHNHSSTADSCNSECTIYTPGRIEKVSIEDGSSAPASAPNK